MPVSSRGQDTWFSATGPGFESPYRYHQSWNTRLAADRGAKRSFPFESIGSADRREPDRPGQHFSEKSPPVLTSAGEQALPVFELPPNNRFQGAPVDRVFSNLLAVADSSLDLTTPLFAGAEFIEE